MPSLSRASFEDFCLDINRFGSKENNVVNVCVIAIKESPSFAETMKAFAAKRKELEQDIYDGLANQKSAFGNRINRVQFASISLSKHTAFESHIFRHIQQPNIKYLVYVTELNMIGGFNNLNDFDIDLDDLLHEEYDALKPLNNFLDADVPVQMLLKNDEFSVLYCYYSELWRLLFYLIIYFLVGFFVVDKFTQNKPASAACVAVALFAYVSYLVYRRVKADQPF